MNDTILDELYDSKDYDYIYSIIKYMINRLNFNNDIIMKTISLIPNINSIITRDDVDQLINLVNIARIMNYLVLVLF